MSPRHQDYLTRKAKGYYSRPCPGCGGKMSLSAQRCASCSGHVPYQQSSRRTRNPNTHCPNGGFGGSRCATHRPHAHCRECMEPCAVGRTRCDICKREAARIALKRLKRAA